jgi:pantoate--beta-alanine ligase
MRSACKAARWNCATLGLVPTMGALHEGHLSLVREARRRCEHVAASIFVNPSQFGANEDFSTYPRTFEEDCALLAREGVDLVFAPAAEEMYPPGAETWVEVEKIGARLDGASRPGHFRGVATVVTKLLNIVQPDVAFFGQKDAAQVAVLQAMVRDLNFDVEIAVCPTVRDADGLALSSRNRHLRGEERRKALVLSRALERVQYEAMEGEHRGAVLKDILLHELRCEEGVRVDYAAVVDARTLETVSDMRDGALVAVAAWVGGTRLIDNVVLCPVREEVETR